MEVYRAGEAAAEVEWKSDNSPLTLADKRSHHFLCERLGQLDSSIPIMSEESAETDYTVRQGWTRYWCLDPLDGTKEFIKRTDQFTINLALIENTQPVMGFIHVPATGHTYWAIQGKGAYVHDGTTHKDIRSNQKIDGWIAVGSSSHGAEAEHDVLSQFPISEFIKAGSALKFCYLASGLADVYYRHGPTMEWDTAAGHILVTEAGAALYYLNNQERNYNKPSLVNPSFLVRIS